MATGRKVAREGAAGNREWRRRRGGAGEREFFSPLLPAPLLPSFPPALRRLRLLQSLPRQLEPPLLRPAPIAGGAAEAVADVGPDLARLLAMTALVERFGQEIARFLANVGVGD